MSDKYKYSFESDDGVWEPELFDTRQEAIDAACTFGDVGQVFWTCRLANPEAPEKVWQAYHWIERVMDELDYMNEGAKNWDSKITHQQYLELESEVRDAIAAWLDRHDLRPKWRLIEHVLQHRITPMSTMPATDRGQIGDGSRASAGDKPPVDE